MLTVLFVVIGLALLILGHEAGHFFAAKFFKLKVDEFGFGFPPRIFAKKRGETEYSANWLPFGGFVRIAGENDRLNGDLGGLDRLPEAEKKRIFLFQPAWKRFVVIAAGVMVNFLAGWFLLSLMFAVGTPPALVVSGVEPGSPAAGAGIREGDVIRNYVRADDFIQFVNGHRGKQVSLELRRGGKEVSVAAVPRSEMKAGQGALGVFLMEAGVPRQGFWRAMRSGLVQAVLISKAVLLTFYLVLKQLVLTGSLLGGVVGPVGIFSVAIEAGRIGFVYLVQLLALISLNLAVVNLIPFPALDGGRLLFIVVEKLKGSPIPRKVEAAVNGLGLVFLLTLVVLITVRDVARLF